MSSPLLECRGVQVAVSADFDVRVPSLRVERGQVLAIIGPNGAGKSVLLRTLAGLQPGASGTFLWDGAPVDTISLEHRRRVTLVLQRAMLERRSVLENAAAGLRFRGVSRREARAQAQVWLRTLGVEHLASRGGRHLSGGEAQRVSLARALSTSPQLLLLDEPTTALDQPTRLALLHDLNPFLRQADRATVIVTHDRVEALLLADRVAVVLGGRIVQQGSPREVFGAPASEPVAEFVGMENRWPASVVASGGGAVRVRSAFGEIEVPGSVEAGRRVLLCIRPEHLQHGTPSPGACTVAGRLRSVSPDGPMLRIALHGPEQVVALLPFADWLRSPESEGQEVRLWFRPELVHLLPLPSGRAARTESP